MDFTNEDRMNYVKAHGNLLNHKQKMRLVRDLNEMDPSILSDGGDSVNVWLHNCSEKIINHMYDVVKARCEYLNGDDVIGLGAPVGVGPLNGLSILCNLRVLRVAHQRLHP